MHPNLNHWREEEDQITEPVRVAHASEHWTTRWRQFWRNHWKPIQIKAPQVDPQLPEFTGIERSAEVMRYSVLSTEYWLSPKGYLREWLRFNAKVAATLLVPSLLVVPLITFTLGQFQTWAMLIAATTASMVLFPLSALLLAGLISALVYLGKSLRLTRQQSRRQLQHGDYYD